MGNGLSCISRKYGNTSAKYFKSYDTKQESKYIVYLDGNNLYSHAMSKFLRTSRFKWIDKIDFALKIITITVQKVMF